jgi:CBS domain-containing protein
MTMQRTAPVLGEATVGDEMTTGVIRCAPQTPLRNVARLMATRGVHGIFVFDHGREDDETTTLWGLVSDLDVVAAACGDIGARTAGDSAVTPLVSVTTDTLLERAAELMAEQGTSHLAVLDPSTHRPIGVLSTLDIARTIGGDPAPPATRSAQVRRHERLVTAEFLESRRRAILAAAEAGLRRARSSHYERAGEREVRRRLESLFDRVATAVARCDLSPVVAYAQGVAGERFSAGYDLAEVQAAFNALEEAIWTRVLAETDATDLAEALGLVSTVLGAGKDALARRYVSLAAQKHAPSLDLRALFTGIEEP